MTGELLLSALGVVGMLLFLTVTTFALVWIERKFLGHIQMRLGPMRTGYHGIMQPVADALKLLFKEDFIPGSSDRLIFWLAPLAVFVPAFLIWVSIPFTKELVIRNLDMGIFYIVAVSVVSIIGLVMAGWGSANKYALLGGARAAAQLISYELPLIMVILSVVMLSQSLDLKTIVEKQAVIPYVLLQPLGFLIFLFASLAEVGRTPFDIPQAESEVVGGPFVEYSGIRWSIFFLAEYVNTFAVGVLGALLFLGGWNWPLLPPIIWILVKSYFLVLVIFWMRATFPRLRIDQLMSLAWKVLLPLAFLNILIVGAHQFYRWPAWSLSLISLVVVLAVGYRLRWRRIAGTSRLGLSLATERRLANDRTP
ncbi:MAG: NADH-quinone oxidoreductase subunit NuoH [Chloroflexi bacterium]|nr:NADH-quinone oxidoreductase subunit NuoH [Chloroflexota bacterium]